MWLWSLFVFVLTSLFDLGLKEQLEAPSQQVYMTSPTDKGF